MMTIKTLLAVVFVAITSTIASAQEGTKAYAGSVVAISDSSITVTTHEGDKVFAIDANTKFIDAASVADIKVGQQVGVRCDEAEKQALLIRGKWPPQ